MLCALQSRYCNLCLFFLERFTYVLIHYLAIPHKSGAYYVWVLSQEQKIQQLTQIETNSGFTGAYNLVVLESIPTMYQEQLLEILIVIGRQQERWQSEIEGDFRDHWHCPSRDRGRHGISRHGGGICGVSFTNVSILSRKEEGHQLALRNSTRVWRQKKDET